MAMSFSGGESGQATVELAVVFPVALIVAVITINVLVSLGVFASFDRQARAAVLAEATSMASGSNSQDSLAAIQRTLDSCFSEDNVEVEVRAQAVSGGHMRYEAEILYYPTLFGLGLKREIFGVPLPVVHHTVQLTVNPYRPGFLL